MQGKTKKHITLYGGCITTFTLVFVAVYILWSFIGEFLYIYLHLPVFRNHWETLFITGSFFIPMILALFVSRRFAWGFLKKHSINLLSPNRTVIAALVIAYFTTGIIGTPAVVDHNDRWAINEVKRINEDENFNLSSTRYPYFRTIIAIPALPFVVCSFHEYQLAPLCGWGGWDVQLWYFVGVKRLFRFTYWIS